ncbi:MAG: endonuclease VIII [Tannerellaceae bacterium]|nr:endonuclease VIII [Tannerellaceae bacterium]MCD8264031.1 endonuclease VIII [Tannerellaceae bacterium]
MLEVPEALFLAGQLNQVIAGKEIQLAVAGYTPHKFTFYSLDVQQYAAQLTGKKVDKATAHGGMIELRINDMLLVFTDGVNLRYLEPGYKLPAKYQFLLGFEDESCMVASVRMYGGIWCLPVNWEQDPPRYFKGTLHEYYLWAKEKPQVMSGDFTESYFLSLIEAAEMQNKSSKAFLATGQKIPGVGNGVLQDILYQAGIHPKTKIKELSAAQKEILFQSLKSTLREIYRQHGRNSETDLFGQSGHYIPYLSKDTAGKECTRCGELIRKENYLGGSIYYCEGCQPSPH